MRLDFETILGIIFFVVFFILPAFNRKKKPEGEETAAPKVPPGTKGAGGQPSAPVGPATAPTRSPQPAGRAAAPQASAQPTPQRAAPQQRPTTATTIEEALEEIRARVREAQQQESARGAGTTRRKAAPQQPAGAPRTGATRGAQPGSLVSAQPTTLGGASGTGGSLVSTPARSIGSTGSTPAQFVIGREGASSPKREHVSAPLEVTRKARRRTLEDGKDLAALGARKTNASRQGVTPVSHRSPTLAMNSNALITGMIWHEVLSEPAARRRLRRTRSRQVRP